MTGPLVSPAGCRSCRIGAAYVLLGAYLLLFPRANLRVLTVVWNCGSVVHVPALLGLTVRLSFELPGLGRAASEFGGSTSYAQLGGFCAGALTLPLLRRPGTALFQAARTRAFSVRPLAGG